MVSRQRGFTIVELMIAIMVMGVSMLLVTVGVIQVSRYYKQAQTKTALLNANRELHAKFAQDLQYSGYDPTQGTVGAYNVICLGTTRYIVDTTSYASNFFGADKINGKGECTTATIVLADTEPIMPPSTKVTNFTLIGSGLGPYTLETRFVAANGEDLFEDNDFTKNCVAVAFGGQYCATGELSSTLVRKVSN